MGYAFISYSEKQRPEAERLRRLLNAHDIRTWMAPYDIPQEAAYADVIHQAIRDASCFVLLLTEDAQNSAYVDKEVERALHYGKTIAPIQLGNVGLNDSFAFYLCNQQIVTVDTVEEVGVRLQRLLEHLQLLCNDQLPQEKTALDASRDKRVIRQRIARALTWTGAGLLVVALLCGEWYRRWAHRLTYEEMYAFAELPEIPAMVRAYLLFFAVALAGILVFLYGCGLRDPQKRGWNPIRVFPLRLMLPSFSALCGAGYALVFLLQSAVAGVTYGLKSYNHSAADYVLPAWVGSAEQMLGWACAVTAVASLAWAFIRRQRGKGGR